MLPIGRCFNLMSERGQTKNGYTCLVDPYSYGVYYLWLYSLYISTLLLLGLPTDTYTLCTFSPCSVLHEGVRGILTCSLVGLHGRPERGWEHGHETSVVCRFDIGLTFIDTDESTCHPPECYHIECHFCNQNSIWAAYLR